MRACADIEIEPGHGCVVVAFHRRGVQEPVADLQRAVLEPVVAGVEVIADPRLQRVRRDAVLRDVDSIVPQISARGAEAGISQGADIDLGVARAERHDVIDAAGVEHIGRRHRAAAAAEHGKPGHTPVVHEGLGEAEGLAD